MKTKLLFAAGAAVAAILTGCETIPPGAERGPHGTMAYDVLVEASAPGARIEVNGEQVGQAPLHLKIFGDPDGTFHDFGSSYYVVKALPLTTNQFTQTRVFMTGHLLGPEDHIPRKIYFDMNQQAPAQAPVYEYAPPPAYYYGPPVYYYGPPVYGPSFHFRFGGPPYHRRW